MTCAIASCELIHIFSIDKCSGKLIVVKHRLRAVIFLTLLVTFVPRYFVDRNPTDRVARARVTSFDVTRECIVKFANEEKSTRKFEIYFFRNLWETEGWRSYDKQMRLGNAAVDNCSSQGLPDFYFFSLSLSLFSSSFPRFFLSLARPFYSPSRLPVRAFLFIASRLTTQEGARRRRCGGGGGGGGRRGSHRDSYLLLSLFSLFPSPPAANDRRCLLSQLSFFFCYYFPSSSSFSLTLYASPRPTATPLAFQPLEQQFIFIASSAPPVLSLSPVRSSPRNPDLNRRSCSSSFYPCCSRVLSSFLSFFPSALLALPVVSNFAKGWRRECAPRPSRGGVFLLPPPPFTLHLALHPLSFFSRFLPLAPFLSLAYVALRSRDREKY